MNTGQAPTPPPPGSHYSPRSDPKESSQHHSSGRLRLRRGTNWRVIDYLWWPDRAGAFISQIEITRDSRVIVDGEEVPNRCAVLEQLAIARDEGRAREIQ